MSQPNEASSNSNRYKKYLLVVLMFILAFNFVDRVALGVLLQSIKTDLRLSDTQLGFMTGIAFALFYSVMGLPIARWADRGNRVTIIAASTAVWSLMVAACGLAGTFVQLLLIRVGVGIGEAGAVPASFSLISDYFKRAERPTATAVFSMGAPLSFLLGYFPAGWLNQEFGWRVTFAVLALPGVALALLAWLTLKEPRLTQPVQNEGAVKEGVVSTPVEDCSAPSPPLRTVLALLWKVRSFRHLLLAYAALFFFTSGLLQWQPTFFLRSYEFATGELGSWFSLIYGAGGLIGTYWGGRLASRYATHDERRQLKATSLAYVTLAIISTAIYITSSLHVALFALVISAIGMYSTTGPLWATIQTVVPERMRATAISILYLSANLVGAGFGPLAVGALSDLLTPSLGAESLRYALLFVSPGLIWPAWHIWRSSATVAQDIEALQRTPQAPNLADSPFCLEHS